MTGNPKSAAIQKLCVFLKASNIHMLNSDDYFDFIVDIGLSKVVTPHFIYFVSGYLITLDGPMSIDGIAELLVTT